MRRVFLLILLVLAALVSCTARGLAQEVPPRAKVHAPQLSIAQQEYWPDAPMPWFMAGQVEKESCLSLTHSKCWNTRAELKTSREYGFGLGQVTIAYHADGSVRFNKWAELRTRHPELRRWSWEERFDASYQLTALVLMDRSLCRAFPDAFSIEDLLGFCLSAYNGGEGGVRQDRRLCSNTDGCNSRRWFGHVELHSMKTRMPWKGYGKSAYQINREYPHEVRARRSKYKQYFQGVGGDG